MEETNNTIKNTNKINKNINKNKNNLVTDRNAFQLHDDVTWETLPMLREEAQKIEQELNISFLTLNEVIFYKNWKNTENKLQDQTT